MSKKKKGAKKKRKAFASYFDSVRAAEAIYYSDAAIANAGVTFKKVIP